MFEMTSQCYLQKNCENSETEYEIQIVMKKKLFCIKEISFRTKHVAKSSLPRKYRMRQTENNLLKLHNYMYIFQSVIKSFFNNLAYQIILL